MGPARRRLMVRFDDADRGGRPRVLGRAAGDRDELAATPSFAGSRSPTCSCESHGPDGTALTGCAKVYLCPRRCAAV
ncbi:MAG: hypothetical protein QOG46_2011 [Pseudonocardiales bacterium]|nr:hypothetical protein [Pseudonocardiales bacterium]